MHSHLTDDQIRVARAYYVQRYGLITFAEMRAAANRTSYHTLAEINALQFAESQSERDAYQALKGRI